MLPISELLNLKSSYGVIIKPRKLQIIDVKPPTRPKIKSREIIDHSTSICCLDCTRSEKNIESVFSKLFR